MNLLENLQDFSLAPFDNREIIVVWYEENLDSPRHFIKPCVYSNGHYSYLSDNDFSHRVKPEKVIGWFFL